MNRLLRRIIAAAPLALLATASFAVTPSSRGKAATEAGNFDARIGLQQDAAAAPAPTQSAELEAFSRSLPDLAVGIDSATGATRTLMNRVGFLTDADGSAAPETIARRWVDANVALLGLTAEDLAGAEVSNLVRHELSGTTNLYLRQRVEGLAVYNGLLQVNLASGGQIVSVNNLFLPRIGAALNTSSPALTADQAIVAAADSLGLAVGSLATPASLAGDRLRFEAPELSTEPIDAVLMVLPIRQGEARLVWNFQVWTLDTLHAWDLTVDAVTGQVWTRFDWVANEQYKVYPVPAESPNHIAPLPPADGRLTEVNPYLDAGLADPFGWHDTNNVAGAESTLTIGNNVIACIDALAPSNSCDPGSLPDGTATLNFTFPLDLTLAPSAYQPGAVANLFYWNNIMHDVSWPYGFNEAGGNFQTNNYGRGGAGNDEVQADGQDGAGTNNANFATPPDGGKPRMQMFIWTAPTPDRDGDVDNGIIAHEYGHGISNRLVGGPATTSCLGNAQQPGEGLSDWWSLFYTHPNDVSPAALIRGIGTYALDQPVTGLGIREQRYDGNPNGGGNTWTYASINGAAIPHGVGSRWAQAYWQVTGALIAEHGYDPDLYAYTNSAADAGNIRAMYYIIQGLKNSICSPAFTDVRDGIIAAATATYGGEDVCTIWTAFAEFGLGSDAVSGGSGSTTPTNGFSIPASCSFLGSTPETQTICAGSPAVYNVTAGAAFTAPVTLALTGNPGATTVGYSVNPIPAVPGGSTITIGNTGAVAGGSYPMSVTGNGDVPNALALTLDVVAAVPVAPSLTLPVNSTSGQPVRPSFQWAAIFGATGYTLEVDDNSDFSSITYTAPVAGTSHVPTVDLPVNTHLYWRVRASNACGTGADSAVFNFSTSAPFSYCRTPGLAIPDNNPGGANDVLVIAASGTIADVDIQLVVTHTWVGDLKFTLSNGGAPVAFYDRPGYTGSGFGCSGDNINATVNDEGPDGNVESQCANLPATSGNRIGGDPASSTLLTAFDGQPVAGSWTLNASDGAGGDTGTVTSWCLLFPDSMPFLDGFETTDTLRWSTTAP